MSSVPPVDEGAQEAGTFTSTSQEDFPSTSLPSAPEDEPRSSPLDTQTIEEIFNDAHPPTSRQARASSSNEDDSQADNHFFQCNICFDPVRQPVVTLCGHLFCWPCIYRWLEQSPSCPVCKAGATKDKLIPIYGRNSEGGNITSDPREEIPERPAAQRPAPIPTPSASPFPDFFQNPWGQGRVSFSAGFGPFGAFHMNWPTSTDQAMTEQQQHQLFISRIVLSLGFVIFLILLIL